MDTTMLLVAAAFLGAIFLAAKLLAALQQGWRPAFSLTGRRQPPVELRVVARLHLTPQHSLHLVEAGGRRLLVACSPQGAQLLRRTRSTSPDRVMAARVGHA
ncbi:MAG: flagellar biosynthetic protein FliO [Bryobacterales bacterium]|nr:flagellar biosynthetic protein FliO [Bryobacterales bacterium]